MKKIMIAAVQFLTAGAGLSCERLKIFLCSGLRIILRMQSVIWRVLEKVDWAGR